MPGDKEQGAATAHALQCMEIWGGNSSIERQLTTPGLDIWIKSTPVAQAASGGDVHYISLCGGGTITRLILADVSGHGEAVADVARSLRDLMRRNINRKSQARLAAALNRQFGELARLQRFATAVVATYQADRKAVTICNAGHPRPLWFRGQTGRWEYIDCDSAESRSGLANLPLGIDDLVAYTAITLQLEPGDRLLFYTDAVTEATNESGAPLGEAGWLRLVSALPRDSGRRFVDLVKARLADCRGVQPRDDDQSLLFLHHSASAVRRRSLRERIDVYAKVFRIKGV